VRAKEQRETERERESERDVPGTLSPELEIPLGADGVIERRVVELAERQVTRILVGDAQNA
jgi:hypothetical protein